MTLISRTELQGCFFVGGVNIVCLLFFVLFNKLCKMYILEKFTSQNENYQIVVLKTEASKDSKSDTSSPGRLVSGLLRTAKKLSCSSSA